MDILLLRFDATLMSFGSVVVDQQNKTDPYPYRSMLTGLVANALGLNRRDKSALAALQSRLRYAARRDRQGAAIVDYQTVDFDSNGPMASELGWTTRGELEERGGGDASEGTHIRFRHYLADAIITVAITLEPPEPHPRLDAVSAAVRSPARPLFLGRKCCLPSGPVWFGEFAAPSLRRALEEVPRVGALRRGGTPRGDADKLHAIWPESEGGDECQTRRFPRVEDRDAMNAVHVGRRIYVEGLVDPPVPLDTHRTASPPSLSGRAP
jgi:CRISPR system Cascade subunit CasD